MDRYAVGTELSGVIHHCIDLYGSDRVAKAESRSNAAESKLLIALSDFDGVTALCLSVVCVWTQTAPGSGSDSNSVQLKERILI